MSTLGPDDPVFADADYVFHFGGMGDIVPSIERPLDYMRANVDGTLAMLEGSRRAGVKRFVYAASSSCYGLAEVPTTEAAPIAPQYPYALSKYMGEVAALHWGKVYRLPVVSLRIFNAYGPRARTTGAYGAVFGVFLAQRAHGRPLTVVGDGTQRRDFVYVTDVARAFLLAAESSINGEVFNVGAGDPQSVNRLVALIGGTVAHAFGIRTGVLASCGLLAAFAAWSAWAREPGIDAMVLPPPPARGFRAAVWEAFTAASHRAQQMVHLPVADIVGGGHVSPQDQDAGGAGAGHRSPAAGEDRDHVPRRLRHRAPRPPPSSDVCEGEGGHPRRQPDRRHLHHEGG